MAGAGGGTGYLGLISYLPDDWAGLRSFLIYTSPLATVLIGVAWVLISSWSYQKITQLQIKSALKRAETIREAIEADPRSTAKHRQNAQAAVEALQALQMEALHAEVSDVRARLRELRTPS